MELQEKKKTHFLLHLGLNLDQYQMAGKETRLGHIKIPLERRQTD